MRYVGREITYEEACLLYALGGQCTDVWYHCVGGSCGDREFGDSILEYPIEDNGGAYPRKGYKYRLLSPTPQEVLDENDLTDSLDE